MTEATKPAARSPEDKQLAEELVERARSEGVELVGPGGLLSGLTKNVLEAGLEAEMSEHLGYDKHDPAGRNTGNSRNGTRTKKLLTEIGPVDIEVPRDRDGSFEPQLVKKRQRRLTGVDETVIWLVAKGLTTGEVSAHMAEVYGARCSSDGWGRPRNVIDRTASHLSGRQRHTDARLMPNDLTQGDIGHYSLAIMLKCADVNYRYAAPINTPRDPTVGLITRRVGFRTTGRTESPFEDEPQLGVLHVTVSPPPRFH